MRTVAYLLAAFFLLACGMPLAAQQVNTAPEKGEKKVIIIKRSTDADGSEVTETIIKKGKAAENFDAERYVRENRSDKVQVEVRVEQAEGDQEERSFFRNFRRMGSDVEEDLEETLGNAMNWSTCDNSAFLGIDEDSDEDQEAPGITVEVVRNSAAAKAGLKTNDVLLRLGDQSINEWDDITDFMSSTKPGDKVRITYSRNGQQATTEATLSTRREVYQEKGSAPARGFLGVSEDDDDEDKAGVQVSITEGSAAEKAGLKDGDLLLQLNDTPLRDFEDISDFMAETTVGDQVKLTYERDGKRNTATATLGEQKSWDWSNWNQPKTWNWQGFNLNTREKSACLGVYTQSKNVGESTGALINGFTDESAAQEASMLEEDVITAVNGVRVKGHDDLWNEIAKYNPGDKVKLDFLRGTQVRNLEVALKACKDNSSKVIINGLNEAGDNLSRRFFTWNWNDQSEQKMRESRVIVIHRGEGDAAKVNPPAETPASPDRKLVLQSFRAYPNPTQGQVTIEFKGEAVPTILSLYDLSGRQLFREELNAFSGTYSQQFDLVEYAKGTLLIQILQGDKVFTEQLVVN